MSTPEPHVGGSFTPPADPPAPKAKMTEYVILVAQNVGDQNWRKEGIAKGHGSEGAIRAWLALKGEEPSGTYVAVPTRSWQPMTPQVETHTTLKFQ